VHWERQCLEPIHAPSGALFNGSEVCALVAQSTSGLKWVCLIASPHNVQDFSNGRACLGQRIVLFNSCGCRPCQISGSMLCPSRLQISERNSTNVEV
jgi:hypothetical protein